MALHTAAGAAVVGAALNPVSARVFFAVISEIALIFPQFFFPSGVDLHAFFSYVVEFFGLFSPGAYW